MGPASTGTGELPSGFPAGGPFRGLARGFVNSAVGAERSPSHLNRITASNNPAPEQIFLKVAILILFISTKSYYIH
jgi:hypothetical protein